MPEDAEEAFAKNARSRAHSASIFCTRMVLRPLAKRRRVLDNQQLMKLLVVDDHPVVREGLAAFLEQLGPNSVVQAGDASRAFALATEHSDLDVVILDLGLPGLNGKSAIAELGRIRPELPVIVLSASEDARQAREALAQGALGYVPKSASRQTLVSAIQLVLNGEVYVPSLVLGEVPEPAPASPGTRFSAGRGLLTDREIEVLKRLSAGQSNKAIARDLKLSEKTVKAHITAIFRALNVLNRTQAAEAARVAGVI
jgi:two-component system, NarL family, nitrate/nitrite response regulator NarL